MKKLENLQSADFEEVSVKSMNDAWIVAGYDNFCVIA